MITHDCATAPGLGIVAQSRGRFLFYYLMIADPSTRRVNADTALAPFPEQQIPALVVEQKPEPETWFF